VRVKPRVFAELLAAVPRVRVGCALVGASVAFVLDDDAITTVAATPITRLTQRTTRAAVGVAFVVAWLIVVVLAADALTGVGRPPNALLMEPAAVALIAFAVACLAIGRTDDGRGGIVGAFVALACFATSYIPTRWTLFTAEPRVSRLLVISAVALALAVAASADPAKRRVRIG
jgi:hypothetical protein